MTCIAGSTSIGEFTQIGLGAIIYDNISIVANTIIGAGTMVRKNILTSGTYVGQTKNKLVKIK
jgi:acetyltransferase-like isoleucine patch superfamily enzyme